MHEGLRKKLCAELDKMEYKGTIGMAELEIINKLTDTVKNIDKINKLNSSSYGDFEAVSYYDKVIETPVTTHMKNDDLTDTMRNMLNSNSVSMEDRKTLEKAMHILTH